MSGCTADIFVDEADSDVFMFSSFAVYAHLRVKSGSDEVIISG